MNNHPEFEVVSADEKTVVIRDLCEQYQCMSVTNGAEEVVARLYNTYGDRQYLYYDTTGALDELLHAKGEFTGFAPGPSR